MALSLSPSVLPKYNQHSAKERIKPYCSHVCRGSFREPGIRKFTHFTLQTAGTLNLAWEPRSIPSPW